ncbi:hypothetical protein DPMN_061800 [Dreissena polymorpha]|uniref:Uncharacterized protein n=1 Tax=Dreissena polymorpha TaxID=45954 RepID=A0A9D4C888_DREPO|nr:hypothetical protein DPMN_061800 [Dreissena polymorpha]
MLNSTEVNLSEKITLWGRSETRDGSKKEEKETRPAENIPCGCTSEQDCKLQSKYHTSASS